MTHNTKHDVRREDYVYTSETKFDSRLIGYPAVLNPHADKTSASRADMFSSHKDQCMVIQGAEFPRQWTGYEYYDGQFSIDPSHRDQDMQIIDVIPKYKLTEGSQRIARNPSVTVIALGARTGLIHCFNIESHISGRNGYGYEAVIKRRYPKPDEWLPKEAVLATSSAHQNNKYCYGAEMNVAYMTLPEGIEDAFLISESAAKKFASVGVYRVSIIVRSDSLPLNHYGNYDDVYKFLPDIGEVVRDDGVLFAARPVRQETYAADCDPRMLRQIQYATDTIIYAPPGAEIVDIDVYTSSHRALTSATIYSQVEKYQNAIATYWQGILAVYDRVKHRAIAPEFNTLVTRAVTMLAAMRVPTRVPGLHGVGNRKVELRGRNNRPVDFIQVDVVYKVDRPVIPGSKFSDRAGAKGVIGRIARDEDMPRDQNGFVADLVIDPTSPIARMNGGQLFEQAINRCSEFVRRELGVHLEHNQPLKAFDTVIDYIRDINPQYADLILRTKESPESRVQFAQRCVREGIYLNILPGMKTITTTLLSHLKQKWKVEVTPVTYTVRDRHGGNPRTFTTIRSVCIGSKYCIILCKLPEPMACGIARISHLGIPVKPGVDGKMQHAVASTPVRLGEDEIRLLMMDVPLGEIIRIVGLQANSHKAMQVALRTILTTDRPTQIARMPITLAEIQQSNGTQAIFHHLMEAIGVESRYTRTQLPIPNFRDDGIDIDDPFSKVRLGDDDDDNSPIGDDLSPPDDDNLEEHTSDDDIAVGGEVEEL